MGNIVTNCFSEKTPHLLFQNSTFFKSTSKEKCPYCCKKLCFFLLGTPRYQISENPQTYVFLRHLLVKTSKVTLSYPNQSKGSHTITHIFDSSRFTVMQETMGYYVPNSQVLTLTGILCSLSIKKHINLSWVTGSIQLSEISAKIIYLVIDKRNIFSGSLIYYA